jgi:hypothetical protein
MKRIYYAALALLLPACTFAQPVLDSAEYYHTGQQFNTMFCTGANAGASGAMQTWDFSNVTDSVCIAIMVDNAPAPATHQMDIAGTIYYLNVNDSETVTTGIDLQAASLEYTPGALLVKHPITYLDTASDSFTSVATAPPAIPGTGTSFMFVDGYGTLTTPEATYDNVLRVMNTHSEHDSGTLADEYVTFISYLWYDSTHTFPLMRIDSIIATGTLPFLQVSAAYYTTQPPTAVNNISHTDAAYSAHIDDNGLSLKADLSQGHEYKVGLLNMNGQVVFVTTFTASGGLEHFNINRQLPRGTYLLSLSEPGSNSKPTSIKVFKQ